MRLSIYALIEVLLIIVVSALWCEVGYYYFIYYYNCSGWPVSDDINALQQKTKIMIVADTHIMGPIKSVTVDKLRREWQMKQAYRIALRVYKPDLVLFMGDLLDEGSFNEDKLFEKAIGDFDRIFLDDIQTDYYVIPGNHDVGFHDQMKHFPYVLNRFTKRYLATSNVHLVDKTLLNNLNVIAINSMSFYNDTCSYCSRSRIIVDHLSDYLEKNRKSSTKTFAQPIILTHIPLYRIDDQNCEYPKSLQSRVVSQNKEGLEVMHKSSSKQLIDKLQPRLILSGHTHMYCTTLHQLDSGKAVEEITISSYNHKYAEKTPGFALLSLGPNTLSIRHCNLVEEWIIISVYLAAFIVMCTRFVVLYKSSCNAKSLPLINETKQM